MFLNLFLMYLILNNTILKNKYKNLFLKYFHDIQVFFYYSMDLHQSNIIYIYTCFNAS